MRNNLDRLGRLLRRDGLDRREFVLMAYASIWLEPEWPYREILEAYADYVNDAPERVHASLCCHLLAAGREMSPEAYINGLKVEVNSENRVLTQ